MTQISTGSEDTPKIHAVFLHDNLKKRSSDRYLVDIAVALKSAGHKVSIYTSKFDKNRCFSEFNTGFLDVFYSGYWLPERLRCLRAIFMAFRMIFFPPKPKPTLIVLDIHSVALFLFAMFTRYKTIYLTNFTSLQRLDEYTKDMKINPDRVTARAMKYADEVLVQTESLRHVFKRSFPRFPKIVKILHPCVDTGLWSSCINTRFRYDSGNLSRIVPDIPDPSFLFVCFGPYRKRSNFEMVVNAFEDLLKISEMNMRHNLHLVIAGTYCEHKAEEKSYYNRMLERAVYKSFASQMTFLWQVPIKYQKTLIKESIAVILACEHEVFPDMVLPILYAGKPIISANTGFAEEALRNGFTAILVEATYEMFREGMCDLLSDPSLQVSLSEKGFDLFMDRYSNFAFRRKVHTIVSQCLKG